MEYKEDAAPSIVSVDIPVGTVEEAKIVYAYPNNPNLNWTLEETIEHWVNQTIQRDYYEGQIWIAVIIDQAANSVVIRMNGGVDVAASINIYAEKIPAIINAGLKAHNTVIPKLKADGLWDPRKKGWRFFMPMGLPMVRTQALQFFHYPPEKMLNNLQDYLNDPVPHRVENLLMNCGVSDRPAAQAYECIVDGAPIAAPDNAGSASGSSSPWGYIPINYFTEYQLEMVQALLGPNFTYPGYTVPIVVYGKHPNKIFSQQFLNGQSLGVNTPQLVEIIPGQKTPVIGAHHPYGFYWVSQVGSNSSTGSVGDGKMLPQNCKRASTMMLGDIISANWMKSASANPSQDLTALMATITAYWNDPQQANQLCRLVQSEATLLYTNSAKTTFKFRVTEDQAGQLCTASQNNTCSFIA